MEVFSLEILLILQTVVVFIALHFNPIVDRIESNTTQLDKAFGTIIFDANSPDWWLTARDHANAASTTGSIKKLEKRWRFLKSY